MNKIVDCPSDTFPGQTLKRAPMTPPPPRDPWRGWEAFSEEGSPEDGLKDKQGPSRKDRKMAAGEALGQAEGGAHSRRWLVAVQGNPRGTGCAAGRGTRATAGQALESALRLTVPGQFHPGGTRRVSDSLRSEPPEGWCRGSRIC